MFPANEGVLRRLGVPAARDRADERPAGTVRYS